MHCLQRNSISLLSAPQRFDSESEGFDTSEPAAFSTVFLATSVFPPPFFDGRFSALRRRKPVSRPDADVGESRYERKKESLNRRSPLSQRSLSSSDHAYAQTLRFPSSSEPSFSPIARQVTQSDTPQYFHRENASLKVLQPCLLTRPRPTFCPASFCFHFHSLRFSEGFSRHRQSFQRPDAGNQKTGFLSFHNFQLLKAHSRSVDAPLHLRPAFSRSRSFFAAAIILALFLPSGVRVSNLANCFKVFCGVCLYFSTSSMISSRASGWNLSRILRRTFRTVSTAVLTNSNGMPTDILAKLETSMARSTPWYCISRSL